MMDGNYVELEAQVAGHQRRLREEAAAERLVRVGCGGRPRRSGFLRRARSIAAAALVGVAGWLDERYAEKGTLSQEWVG